MSVAYKGIAAIGTIREIEDRSFSLTCSCYSNPAANYTWTYPGGYLTGSTITLQLKRNNTGEFICHAKNTMLFDNGLVQGRNETVVNILVLCK